MITIEWSKRCWLLYGFAMLLACAIASPVQTATGWRAGVAAAVITPDRPMRMMGYFRPGPYTSVAHDLHAKALALQDPDGVRFVLVTLDLAIVLRSLREDIERLAQRRFGLAPQFLMLNASHTHCGPEYREDGDEPPEAVRPYNLLLRERIVDAIGRALADLAPATVSYAHARAGFAMNRRADYTLAPNDPRRKAPNPRGPVDHDVPILKVERPGGKLHAVAFGYACHNTTVGFMELNGDYAGYAQIFLEEAHPGATALFVMGCGGDQNPHPRSLRTGDTMVPGIKPLDLARMHGENLGLAVEAALNVVPREIKGSLRAAYEKVNLDYMMPTREELLQRTVAGSEKEESRRRGARKLLAQMDRGELRRSYDYPVQVVLLGDVVTLVALGSEVVVDYSLRLKREIPGEGTWVAGYSNDWSGYMGSRRVIEEGGAEGGLSNLGRHPGNWALTIEERIVGKVHQLRERLNGMGSSRPAPFP